MFTIDSIGRMELGPTQPHQQSSVSDSASGASRKVKYCIITPCRDEEDFVARTVESVLRQTIKPSEWIIVDDGSTDATGAILSRYRQNHPWIKILSRKDRGYRSTGGGAEAFIEAYREIASDDWEFLVNLDSDLTFDSEYFEKCFEQFERMPRLGIGGGTIFDKVGDKLRLDPAPSFHVRGGTKIYRRQCWEQLGGIVGGLGWDTADEVKANQIGWTTYTFPNLKLIHHRVTGGAWGAWANAKKDGESDFIVGYHPLFFFLKCLRRIFRPPLLVNALGSLCGYLGCAWRGTPRIGDSRQRQYLRQQQLRRLFGLSSIWK